MKGLSWAELYNNFSFYCDKYIETGDEYYLADIDMFDKEIANKVFKARNDESERSDT